MLILQIYSTYSCLTWNLLSLLFEVKVHLLKAITPEIATEYWCCSGATSDHICTVWIWSDVLWLWITLCLLKICMNWMYLLLFAIHYHRNSLLLCPAVVDLSLRPYYIGIYFLIALSSYKNLPGVGFLSSIRSVPLKIFKIVRSWVGAGGRVENPR